MAAVIVAADAKNNGMDYLSQLGLARRTHKHGSSLSDPNELALTSAEVYHEWLKESGLNNCKQSLKTYYKEVCKVRLAKDGNNVVGGYMVLKGTLMGLFSHKKGLGNWLVQQALMDGAESLDCFDGHLPEFYKRHGFYETHREANWAEGGPDVVFMALKGE